MLRLVVTGSREWNDRRYVWKVLDGLLAEHGAVILLHGVCPTGADAIADEWARDRLSKGEPVLVGRFPANWDRYGAAAGPIRNREMVEALRSADGPTVACHAFVGPGQSRGTKGCVELAKAAGVPVTVHEWADREVAGG